MKKLFLLLLLCLTTVACQLMPTPVPPTNTPTPTPTIAIHYYSLCVLDAAQSNMYKGTCPGGPRVALSLKKGNLGYIGYIPAIKEFQGTCALVDYQTNKVRQDAVFTYSCPSGLFVVYTSTHTDKPLCFFEERSLVNLIIVYPLGGGKWLRIYLERVGYLEWYIVYSP